MASPEKTTKVAIDESRMLVLVVEVLIGFGFQGVFQPGFPRLSAAAQHVAFVAFVLLLFTMGLLLMIPAHHRIVEGGRDSGRFLRFATVTMGCLLLPFAVALAMEVFVVSEKVIGAFPAVCLSSIILLAATGAWFVLPGFRAFRSRSKPPQSLAMKNEMPPLKDRINQVLTECRVVLPGTQALLGFQLIAFLTDAFEKLSRGLQLVHLAALAWILISAILLMLPAAYHRIGERGRDSEHLFRLSNRCLMAALVALAVGISLDFYVLAERILNTPLEAAASAGLAFAFFVLAWFVIPIGRRSRT